MKKLAFISILLCGLVSAAHSQQTIFNVPTVDVLDQGKVYVELDAAFKIDRTNDFARFSGFVPRLVVGVGGNVEVGVNVIGNIQPGSDSTTIVPTVKWRAYQPRKKDVSVIAGSNIYIPVRNRSYNIGTWSYLAVSKTFDKTRLTAGGYVASKNVFAAKAVRSGGQFGVEHAVNDKLTFAADWITGRHSAGYFTPGVIYKPHPKVTTYWSYSIGNGQATQGNHFFLFELGYNFN
ncbi:MAG TPA: hypothetical protein PKA82_04245 [Pyrinomonadaceae bacterium]|nr:hypothetical protein [Pyrinomonadaceae bacterium]